MYKGNDHQLKKLLFVEQTVSSTTQKMYREQLENMHIDVGV